MCTEEYLKPDKRFFIINKVQINTALMKKIYYLKFKAFTHDPLYAFDKKYVLILSNENYEVKKYSGEYISNSPYLING